MHVSLAIAWASAIVAAIVELINYRGNCGTRDLFYALGIGGKLILAMGLATMTAFQIMWARLSMCESHENYKELHDFNINHLVQENGQPSIELADRINSANSEDDKIVTKGDGEVGAILDSSFCKNFSNKQSSTASSYKDQFFAMIKSFSNLLSFEPALASKLEVANKFQRCMTANGQMDESCKCLKSNSCMNINFNEQVFGSMAQDENMMKAKEMMSRMYRGDLDPLTYPHQEAIELTKKIGKIEKNLHEKLKFNGKEKEEGKENGDEKIDVSKEVIAQTFQNIFKNFPFGKNELVIQSIYKDKRGSQYYQKYITNSSSPSKTDNLKVYLDNLIAKAIEVKVIVFLEEKYIFAGNQMGKNRDEIKGFLKNSPKTLQEIENQLNKLKKLKN